MKRAIKDLCTVQWENPEIRYNPKFDNPRHQQAVDPCPPGFERCPFLL